jgi:hypothetical protein
MDGSGFDSFIILKLGWFCFSVLISKTSKGTMQKNKNKIIYIYIYILKKKLIISKVLKCQTNTN